MVWGSLGHMNLLALEIFYITLLVIAGIAMAWFAGLVVWRMYKGQK
ncbi:hypothetical protein GCM10027562_05220 [Arthrobacter pigmenti]